MAGARAAPRIEVEPKFTSPQGMTAETLKQRGIKSAAALREMGYEMSLLKVPDEIAEVYQLEVDSFDPSECISREAFIKRSTDAKDLFYVLRHASDNRLAGFICSTLSERAVWTKKALETHNKDGTNICINSVVIASDFRRRGLALDFMRAYLGAVVDKGIQFTLIARPPITRLYEKCGFLADGWSDVKLGNEPWMHMTLLYN